MKNGWQDRPLADFVTSRPGNNKIIKGTQSDKPGDGLIQGFSAAGPDVWVRVADYNQPGVVISAVGARCGKTFMADGEWTAIANTHVLLPSDDIDPRWLWYRTNDEDFWIRGGTAQPFVKVKGTLQQLCRIPPLPEQQRIVGVLDEAFDGIATAKANAETNLQNARAIFQSHLQYVFTQRGKGWVEKPLGELASFRNGINFTKSSRGESVKIVGVRNFQQNFWAPLDDLDTVTTDGVLPDSDMLKENDVLFVRSNGNMALIGRSVLVGKIADKITHSGFTIRARLNGEGVAARYLCHFLKSNNARQKMIDGGIGTSIKSLNQTTLSQLIVPLPSADQQTSIAAQVDAIDAETQRLATLYQRKLTALEELKKSLLHQAFTGQLGAPAA